MVVVLFAFNCFVGLRFFDLLFNFETKRNLLTSLLMMPLVLLSLLPTVLPPGAAVVLWVVAILIVDTHTTARLAVTGREGGHRK